LILDVTSLYIKEPPYYVFPQPSTNNKLITSSKSTIHTILSVSKNIIQLTYHTYNNNTNMYIPVMLNHPK
jgi:hypothetical protein